MSLVFVSSPTTLKSLPYRVVVIIKHTGWHIIGNYESPSFPSHYDYWEIKKSMKLQNFYL